MANVQRRVLFLSAIVGAVAVMTLVMMPSPIDPEPISFNSSLPKLEGALSLNNHLSGAKKLFEGQIIGPESFAVGKDGTLYTGCADGKVWKVQNGQLRLLTRTGIDHEDCGSYDLEPECGRPKGMRLDGQGRLVLADSYKGILRVNTDTGQTEVLLDSFDGKPFKFLNDLDISSNGTIYFTDSTTKWERRNYRYEVIETNRLGRIIGLNPNTGEAWLVRDGLYLANGLLLSEDESFLLVAEMSVARISKIYIQGPKMGEMETFVDNLPGYPDNIEGNSRGTLYIALASVRFEGASPLGPFLDNVGKYPSIKRFLTKLVPKWAFDLFLPKHSLFLEIDQSGQMLSSHHDPGAKIFPALSEVYEHDDLVYFGNFKINFIGVVKISDLYPDEH